MNRRNRITTWSALVLAAAAGAGGAYLRRAHADAPIDTGRPIAIAVPAPGSSAEMIDRALEKAKEGAKAMSADEIRKSLEATGDEEVERLRTVLDDAKAAHARGLEEHKALQAELIVLTRDPAHVDEKKLDVLRGKIDAIEDELLESTRHVQDAVMALAPAYERAALAKLTKPAPSVTP